MKDIVLSMIEDIQCGTADWLEDYTAFYRAWGAALNPDHAACAFSALHGQIQAAQELHKAMVPNHTRAVDATMPETGIVVEIYESGVEGSFRGESSCEARAWVIAILKAYVASTWKVEPPVRKPVATRSPGLDKGLVALRVAAKTMSAYSADRFGAVAWVESADLLLGDGFPEHVVENILRSKQTRWASDTGRPKSELAAVLYGQICKQGWDSIMEEFDINYSCE